jgi:hypothetical protein
MATMIKNTLTREQIEAAEVGDRVTFITGGNSRQRERRSFIIDRIVSKGVIQNNSKSDGLFYMQFEYACPKYAKSGIRSISKAGVVENMPEAVISAPRKTKEN